MLKNYTKLEFNLNGRDYEFNCPQDAPLVDVKDAVFRIMTFVGQVEEASKLAAEAAQKAAPPEVDVGSSI